ncbi:MAG: isocitrate lyase/phosphoenolpyruvate mutase family protein [Dehalococcoidia bacterium]|nr:isocitrate lyase/phosphoenolpyruvate mutase family protein [Dehalococcoidia bacterium]
MSDTLPVSAEALERSNRDADRLRELISAPGILIMPGAYDTVTAQLFEAMGFQAIQGTSGGIAGALGYQDGEVISREMMVEVYRRMVEAVQVPVNADGEKGYGGPEDVAVTVERLVAVGAAGINLEDGDYRRGGGAARLIALDLAKAKIEAFMAKRRSLGSKLFLNARVDAFLASDDHSSALNEAIVRGNEYAALGADCILFTRAGGTETIRILAREVKAPISILAGPDSPPPAELEEIGLARVSYGASFFNQALAGVKALAEILLAEDDPREQLNQGFPSRGFQGLRTALK